MLRFYSIGSLLLTLGWVVGSIDAHAADVNPSTTPYEQVSEMMEGAEGVGSPLASEALSEEREQTQNVDASMLRQAIAALDLLTELEQEQLLPWLFNAIAQEADARLHGELASALDEKMVQRDLQADPTTIAERSGELQPSDIPGAAEEQASFEALLKREQGPTPPEEEIRKQIDALVFNPEKPAIALTQAMEIAGDIERIEDEGVRLALRRVLEDRVMAFQAGW